MTQFSNKTWCMLLVLITGWLSTTAQEPVAAGNMVIRGKITDRKSKMAIHYASVSEADADGRIMGVLPLDIEGNYVIGHPPVLKQDIRFLRRLLKPLPNH